MMARNYRAALLKGTEVGDGSKTMSVPRGRGQHTEVGEGSKTMSVPRGQQHTEVREGSKPMSVPRGEQAKVENGLERGQDLIPGIPDAITLSLISTKLWWKDIHKLMLVSRGWLSAIRSRQVYNARVRSKSTDTLLVSNHNPAENVHAITLVTLRGEGATRYKLPPLSSESFDDIVDPEHRSVTFDGKVYVFGGSDCKVHVFDVAGHGRWKQCASVHQPREEFACGVLDGKIFVFGGAVKHEYTSGPDVYNPRKNTWPKVSPLVTLHCGQDVGRVPRKFLVWGKEFLQSETVSSRTNIRIGMEWMIPYVPRRSPGRQVGDASLLEEYDPVEDKWRLVQPVGCQKEKMFVGGGKFYSLSPIGIYVYDFHGHLWTHLHSFSFPAGDDSIELWPLAILTEDREILALVGWPGTNRLSLVQSSGLGSQNRELVWQNAELGIPYKYGDCLTVHSLMTSMLL